MFGASAAAGRAGALPVGIMVTNTSPPLILMEPHVSEASARGRARRLKNQASSETFLSVTGHLGSSFSSVLPSRLSQAETRGRRGGQGAAPPPAHPWGLLVLCSHSPQLQASLAQLLSLHLQISPPTEMPPPPPSPQGFT